MLAGDSAKNESMAFVLSLPVESMELLPGKTRMLCFGFLALVVSPSSSCILMFSVPSELLTASELS